MLCTTTRKLFEAEPLHPEVQRYFERHGEVNDDPLPLVKILSRCHGVQEMLQALPTVLVPDGDVRLLNCDLAERAALAFDQRHPDWGPLCAFVEAARSAAISSADPMRAADLLASNAEKVHGVLAKCTGKGSVHLAARDAAAAVEGCLAPLNHSRSKSARIAYSAVEAIASFAAANHTGRRSYAWGKDTAWMDAMRREEAWQRKCVTEWLAKQDATSPGGAA